MKICKKVFLITSIISIACSYTERTKDCEIGQLSVALKSDFFKKKYKHDSLMLIINNLMEMKCLQADTLIYNFTVNSNIYRQYSLRALARKRSPLYIKFLKENIDSIDPATLAWSINWLPRREPWINHELNELFVNIGLNDFRASFRMDAISYLSDVCRYQDAKKLIQNLDKEPDPEVRRWIYTCLIRFHSDLFDSIIIDGMNNGQITNEYFYTMDVKSNNRYDLLTTLYQLRDKMKNETDKFKIENARIVYYAINEIIPYLEKKKADKAPIGLPLDWGVEKKNGKSVTSK
jgi:hypothetical protein